MKRLNPITNKPYVFGDKRKDGWIFEAYKPSVIRASGYYKESWMSPETFEKNKIRKNNLRNDIRLKNPEKNRSYKKWHAKQNPAQYAAKASKRRAAKLQRTPTWLSKDDLWLIQQAYELAELRTRLFGYVWHVDHIIPLQGKLVSGLHVPTNLQVIPGAENCKKNNAYQP